MKELENQIRVANIIEDGRLAGPQNRMMMVASALNKKFDTIILFPKKNSNDFQQKCNKLGIKYLLLPLTTMSSKWALILKYLFLLPYEILKLFIVLRKNRFDLVHVSGGCWQLKGVIAAKLAKIKVVWHLNDTKAPYLIRKIFSFLSPMADTFIFASEKTKKYYEDLIPLKKKNYIIQSPVDINFFDPNIEYGTHEFQIKFLKEKKIIVGTIGNINPNKGHTTLLKTIKLLSLYSNNLIFLIAGPVYESQKKYFNYLNEIIKKEDIKNIYFLESKKDIRPILDIIDIYVCSSENEASPLSVWEAMSMEKAIVSTDVGDVGKFILHGINGYIVEKGDSSSLANNIIKLINKPELRKNFGKSSRLIAKSKLDISLCVNLHESVYQKTLFEKANKISK